jgi:hypothetical protein
VSDSRTSISQLIRPAQELSGRGVPFNHPPQKAFWGFGAEPGYADDRAALDGSSVNQSFIPNAGPFPCGIAVDDSHIYWANTFGGTTIRRADFDGSNVDTAFISGIGSPCGVAVGGGFLYWGSISTDAVGRATIDGQTVDLGFIATGASPCGVGVDAGLPSRPAPTMSWQGLLLAVALLAALGGATLLRRPSLASHADER